MCQSPGILETGREKIPIGRRTNGGVEITEGDDREHCAQWPGQRFIGVIYAFSNQISSSHRSPPLPGYLTHSLRLKSNRFTTLAGQPTATE